MVFRNLKEVRQKMFPLYLVYVSIGSFSMPLGGLPGPGPWELWRGGGKVNAQLLTGIFTNPSPFFPIFPQIFLPSYSPEDDNNLEQ